MQQHIIGLGHYSRTGKTTLAHLIANECERVGLAAEVRPFASTLKKVVHLVYGWAGAQPEEYYETYPEERKRRLVKLANHKWPLGPTIVDLWIEVGTPAFRDTIFDETWVMNTLETDFENVLIIPDVRFMNEINAIRVRGGRVYKVIRKGVQPRFNSIADNALNYYVGWDEVIRNHGEGLHDLQQDARRIVRSLETANA